MSWLFGLGMAASLVLGDISPDSGIDISSPCQAGDSADSEIGIYQQGDIDAISNCTTFNGSIYIGKGFPGDVLIPNLEFLNGSISSGGYRTSPEPTPLGNLTGLLLPNLKGAVESLAQSPARYFEISIVGVPKLQSLWLPQTLHSTEYLTLYSLPSLTNLSSLTFRTKGSKSSELIINATSLSQLSIRVNVEDDDSEPVFTYWHILNNGKLADFTAVGDHVFPFPSEIMLINNTNLARFSIDSDSNLTTLGTIETNLVVDKCPMLETLSLPGSPTRTEISAGRIWINDCRSLKNISLPNLMSVQMDFVVQGCPSLQSMYTPVLESIGGMLNISNNSRSNAVISMPILQMVSEEVNMDGGFSVVEMPQLNHAYNGFVINSSSTSSFSCSEFDRLHSLGFIRGNYSCLGAKATNDTAPPNINTTVPPDKPSSSLSTGAKAGIGAGVGAAAAAILGLLLWWFCLRKPSNQEDKTPINTTAELPQGKHYEKTEVPAISKPGELHAHSVGEGFQYTVPRKPVAQAERQDVLVGNEGETHELQ